MFSSPSKTGRPQSEDENKENLWSSLLDNVASGKRLPEKYIFLLGGSTEIQKDFLDTLGSETGRRPQDRNSKIPPVANEFALGYTYQDVLDADQEDTLARLSIYTLQHASSSFTQLLKPLLTKQNIPESILVILLDWNEPWNWVRQIRDWIRLLHKVLSTLDQDVKDVMSEVMQDWEQRRRGGSLEGGPGGNNETNVKIPLGNGEWDEGLGLPLCVVCHNCDKIDVMEKEYSWREEEFDYVLQFLRTILLKHGASLIYTSNSMPNTLPTLVQASLGIQSVLKRQPLKHNVVDRDKILVPPNWDSWNKIQILRPGFDVEAISNAWSVEIQPDSLKGPKGASKSEDVDEEDESSDDKKASGEEQTALAAYEDTITNPKASNGLNGLPSAQKGIEVETQAMQDFLAGQSEVMDRLKTEDGADGDAKSPTVAGANKKPGDELDTGEVDRVNEHIGPVQFNMGGIQVDAEDMLRRLKDRERGETPDPENPAPAVATPDNKQQNEALASFFAGLIKRGGSNSPKPPPK